MCSQKHRRMIKICISYLVYSRIWLNFPKDYRQFLYIFLWMIATLATNINLLYKKKALVMRANEELGHPKKWLIQCLWEQVTTQCQDSTLYDDSIRCNLCFNQKKSIKGRGKLSPWIERFCHTQKSFAFIAWRLDAWRGSKTNYQKKPKCLKNERPLQ